MLLVFCSVWFYSVHTFIQTSSNEIVDSQQNKSIIYSFHPIKFDWWYNVLVSQRLSFDSNLVNREAQIPNNVTKGKIDCHFRPIRLEYLRENDQSEAWYMGVVTCRECVTRKAWGGFLRSIKTWGRCFICLWQWLIICNRCKTVVFHLVTCMG